MRAYFVHHRLMLVWKDGIGVYRGRETGKGKEEGREGGGDRVTDYSPISAQSRAFCMT